jgi:hypothetical protein
MRENSKFLGLRQITDVVCVMTDPSELFSSPSPPPIDNLGTNNSGGDFVTSPPTAMENRSYS